MSELPAFDKLFRLDGKVALISGGSRGLGLHTATAFLLAGAEKVILVSRKAEGALGLNQAVERLNSLPGIAGKARSIAADLSKENEIKRVVSEITESEGRLDILIANAAATWGGPFEPTPAWASAKVLELNVRSIFLLLQL
jgi:NAD(P)-dependent dehydrogenase (short-subunit alcohol dehydrogenase family)